MCDSSWVDLGGGLACLLPCGLCVLVQPKQAGLGCFQEKNWRWGGQPCPLQLPVHAEGAVYFAPSSMGLTCSLSQALSVGIFPSVLKLLQSSARELRPLLVFIWAKILAVDSVSNVCLPPTSTGELLRAGRGAWHCCPRRLHLASCLPWPPSLPGEALLPLGPVVVCHTGPRLTYCLCALPLPNP